MNERSASYATRPDVATPRVLIADDQPDVLEALRLLLKGEGFRIESAGSPAAILEAVDSTELDAVLMDLNYARDTTSGQEGLDLLSELPHVLPDVLPGHSPAPFHPSRLYLAHVPAFRRRNDDDLQRGVSCNLSSNLCLPRAAVVPFDHESTSDCMRMVTCH